MSGGTMMSCPSTWSAIRTLTVTIIGILSENGEDFSLHSLLPCLLLDYISTSSIPLDSMVPPMMLLHLLSLHLWKELPKKDMEQEEVS